MTHKNIYTKFLIEYDKANVTSSYPSLTKYEAATILDKAYLALLAQKVTGNNPRQIAFEGDIKAIEDIRPLVKSVRHGLVKTSGYISNRYQTNIPKDSLYIVQANLDLQYGQERPMDKAEFRSWPVQIVSHDIATKFFSTPYNMPWVKQPVGYIENGFIYFLVDSMWHDLYDIINMVYTNITYIKEPKKFVGDTDETEFELSDSMAEELINLAIIMALENVESPRLQTKAQTRSLEA